ncbi:unnamed protein product [Prunus brigantina]
MFRPSSDGRDFVHGPHLRSTLKPIGHHCLRSVSTLPVVPSSPLHNSAGFGVHFCKFCSQGCLPSLHVWWSYGSFCEPWPSFCTRVHRHFHSHVYYHCRCH